MLQAIRVFTICLLNATFFVLKPATSSFLTRVPETHTFLSLIEAYDTLYISSLNQTPELCLSQTQHTSTVHVYTADALSYFLDVSFGIFPDLFALYRVSVLFLSHLSTVFTFIFLKLSRDFQPLFLSSAL